MKLIYSFLKDMKLTQKSFYFFMEIFMAVLFILVILFVVPEKISSARTVYAFLDVPQAGQLLSNQNFGMEEAKLTLFDSMEELENALSKKRTAIGLHVTQGTDGYNFEFIMQGYEAEKLLNILKTSIETGIAGKLNMYNDVTTVKTITSNTEKLPLRINILPIYLGMNAAFLGMFIIAAYVFLDKEEGTIKALAVTPAKIWHYLAAKIGVMMVTGLVVGILVTLCVAGVKANYLLLIILLMATNAFGSALGLFISSFFSNMTKAMGWLFLMVFILVFASISYYMPAFSPLAIRLLPSYPMLFAFREVLLDSGNAGYVLLNVAGYSAAALVLFFLANLKFKRTLTV